MSDVVIKAENLGKRYTIGHQTGKAGSTTFRETLIQNARNLWNKTCDLARGRPIIPGDTQEEVWALKGVCFEIRRGEAVGIIGRNGAGKSTLLKILSRITEPTEGCVTIRGRVASLLEVGTGFHSELSGRENIFLNGTILGMTQAEIKRKFDEIVAFAEVEKYLDTPVKRYSSGMYVRLAFAVAAHLKAEILLVDEVLAVGDAEFQKKCLGKMGDVTQQGRTVLYVSHQLDTIKRLCSRSMLLSHGKLAAEGEPGQIVEKYLSHQENVNITEWSNPIADDHRKGYLSVIRILNEKRMPSYIYTRDHEILIELILQIHERNNNWVIRCDLIKDGAVVLRTSDFDMIEPDNESGWEKGTYAVQITIPAYFLNYGRYSVRPHFGVYNIESVFFPPEGLISFEVTKETKCNHFVSQLTERNHPGGIYPNLPWKIKRLCDENDS